MKKTAQLSTNMTEKQFDNGYWYATEVRAFARAIGIPSSSRLRKDELELAIKHFLRTGRVKALVRRRFSKTGIKDSDKGLKLDLPIVNYTHNRATKDFIAREAASLAPDFKEKPGVRLRLSRWREEQAEKGRKITYGDLVRQYLKLNQVRGRFSQLPSGRYINFLSDFMADNRKATRKQALDAWAELKLLDAPKTYRSWKDHCRRKRKRN